MLERWTAFLAQAAATVLVLIGLVVLLSFTHMKSYRAGLCANNACDAAAIENQTVANPVVPQSSDSGLLNATAALPSTQSARPAGSSVTPQDTNPGSDLQADLPPNQVFGDSGRPQADSGLPVDDDVTGSNARRGTSSRTLDESVSFFTGRGYGSGSYYPTPGDDICHGFDRPVTNAALARCWLRIGDAYQSIGELDYAQYAWNRSVSTGARRGGAQASLTAQQRLQSAALAQACRTSPVSLERISRGYARENVGGEIIDLQLLQQSLAALGYYAEEVDGTYGPATRRAVRDFQADMGFDQTGALNPQETVDLVCHAAITARDEGAQNLLGIMFATGLGVELNVDMALEWLEIAATRGHPEANFNLALVYGTGTVQGSYRLCGVVESPERADSYLRRASELGHARSRFIRDNEGLRGTATARWGRIARRLASEAAQSPSDPFYQAWQERLDEAERDAVFDSIQPGCYLDAVADRRASGEDPAP